MRIITHSVEETVALGRLIGRLAPSPPETLCIALDGPLGTGKTHLTHGIAEGAAVDDPTLASSPTYVLMNIYPGPKPIYHLDAYRIGSEDDFDALGFDELLTGGGIVVVEWAARIPHLLPADRLQISLQHADDSPLPPGAGEEHTTRLIDMQPQGQTARRAFKQIAIQWQRDHGNSGA